ncbi:MAG: DUF448 domain-containing protein [Aliifodinibius sp.]|nr:YlxR family protein [Fodinibius sp.]NIY28458.1 DUF448 domain-containing protein [Fodinibius sp.]
MGRKKHVPQRTCVACREVKAKRELIRIVRTPEQTLIIDETGKAQGRGAYLCKQPLCWASKRSLKDLIGRALKLPITDEEWALVEERLSSLAG